MDEERLKALSRMKFFIGDQEIDEPKWNNLNIFLNAAFGKKRLIILKVNGRKAEVLKELKRYCTERNLEHYALNGENLKADAVRGEIEISYLGNEPFSDRKRPFYISGKKQMIVVDNIDDNTDKEMLRAFMYMAALEGFYNDIENLPKDKLPYGSAYVFIAEDDFPIKKFASISSYWNDEAAIIDLRDFQTRVEEHLGKYKIDKLKILEDGVFTYNNKEIPKKYILPEDKYRLNIIEEYRDDFFYSEYKDIKFHKYFHHLNSSQAMCINLFYPLIKEDYLGVILDIIGLQRENTCEIKYTGFEKESDLEEGARRKTNFDFYIELKLGVKIYFEIKYTENGFGKAEHDPEHIDKFNNVYKAKLAENVTIREAFKSEEYFLDNYQIMRNIVHIDRDSYVVFLYPRENSNIRKQALITRKEVIENSFTDHFICYTLDDMVEQLILRLPLGKLKDYYENQFTCKYLEY